MGITEGLIDKANGYKTGLVLGMIGGFLFARYTNSGVIKCTIIGGIAFGFVGHKISQIYSPDRKRKEFKFYGVEKENNE